MEHELRADRILFRDLVRKWKMAAAISFRVDGFRLRARVFISMFMMGITRVSIWLIGVVRISAKSH